MPLRWRSTTRRQGSHLEFPVCDDDRRAIASQWPGMGQQPYVCVHPGAQLPSRRWPPERFAAIGDELARAGHEVVITGTAAELPLVEAVQQKMHAPATSLAGQTSLWSLGALIERARLLVCNDTGVSHVAAALGTPSVVVSLGSDVARWSPPDAQRHRVLWRPMACRPCGHGVCPVGHGCATQLHTDEVIEAVRDSLSARPAEARPMHTSISILQSAGMSAAHHRHDAFALQGRPA